MRVRPLDENGDMMPVAYSSQMKTGGEAVAQVVKQRLSLYLGEWWEDDTIGFRLPEFLVDGARSGNVQGLMQYIMSYIAETQEVSGVDSAVIERNGRSMTLRCVVHVEEESETVEVDLDGVLSSEY